MNIKDSLQEAIQKKGFEKPTEVQEKVVPLALAGKDIVGKSKTGTGKTAAFAIPMIEKILPGTQNAALVVTPTRELALQVKTEIESLMGESGIRALAVFGGQSIETQLRALRQKPEIIVGTPGRLIDLVERRVLDFSATRFLVLDEADKMFDMGFREDIEKIASFLPRERQTMLFSATMPQQILDLADKYLKKDKEIVDLSSDNAPIEEVEQFYLPVHSREKIEALHAVLHREINSKTLVFCRTKRTVDWLERQLFRRRIRVIAIHGDKKQNMRTRVIEEYKRAKSHVLIATDVVARGIHVDNIDLVINFDFPEETETYIHRVGRTARQGKSGKAITFCANVAEFELLQRIVQRNGAQLKKLA
ncbi:MAG: DEAD/DEAH box helicase [Candidatus Diapherotrites archaeon]|nr:DEAD/DEAH box helicase [Candidatus Diapherotrites archaeon]